MGTEASSVAAVLNVPTASPFALSPLKHVQLARSNHVFPSVGRLVWIRNSVFCCFFFQNGAFVLTYQTKHFFFLLQTGHFWKMKIKDIFGFPIAALLFRLFKAKLKKLRKGYN